MQNPDFAEADIDLLRKVWPSHPLIPQARRNPVRYANEVLYTLLDKQTREEIRLNRRQYEQLNSKENDDPNTGGSDASPDGDTTSPSNDSSGPDNPTISGGDNNPSVETPAETEKTQATEETQEKVAEVEEYVQELESENEELQEKLEEEIQAREEAETALEEEKKSPVPNPLVKSESSKKKKSIPTSAGKTSNPKTSKRQR